MVYMESEALGSSCIHVWMWFSCKKLSNGSCTAKVSCVVYFHLFCGAEDQTLGLPCVKKTICFLKRNMSIYLYIYICIDWESWSRTKSNMICLYHRKDLLFNVCVCFHFFVLLLWVCVCVQHVSICMCVWVYALACVDIGEQFKLGFFIYHFTSYFWDRAALLNLAGHCFHWFH